jgi:hypothetical protein
MEALVVPAARLSLRVPEAEKRLWLSEARSLGLSLTELVRLRMSGQQQVRSSPEMELIVQRVLAEERDLLPGLIREVVEEDLPGVVEAVLQERSAASLPTSPPLYVAPRPYERGCLDADLHGNGLCKSCGGSFFG